MVLYNRGQRGFDCDDDFLQHIHIQFNDGRCVRFGVLPPRNIIIVVDMWTSDRTSGVVRVAQVNPRHTLSRTSHVTLLHVTLLHVTRVCRLHRS